MAASSFDWGSVGRSQNILTPIGIEGAKAYKVGNDRSGCPYPDGSEQQKEWNDGFDFASLRTYHSGDEALDDLIGSFNKKPRNSSRQSKSQQSPNWQWGDRRKAAAQTAKTIQIHTPDRPRINAAGRFLVLTVMSTFTVLSMQVWITYSDTLLRQINRIPLLGLIVQAPMVGGVIEFFGPWFPDLFGVGVWALINACQSGKDIIKLLDIRDPWWVAMLADWSRPQYVAAAYIAEIVLNYDKFPLFKGGIDYLIDNRDSLDMDLFLWPNVFYLLISVLSFEHLVKFFTPKSAKSNRGTTRNP